MIRWSKKWSKRWSKIRSKKVAAVLRRVQLRQPRRILVKILSIYWSNIIKYWSNTGQSYGCPSPTAVPVPSIRADVRAVCACARARMSPSVRLCPRNPALGAAASVDDWEHTHTPSLGAHVRARARGRLRAPERARAPAHIQGGGGEGAPDTPARSGARAIRVRPRSAYPGDPSQAGGAGVVVDEAPRDLPEPGGRIRAVESLWSNLCGQTFVVESLCVVESLWSYLCGRIFVVKSLWSIWVVKSMQMVSCGHILAAALSKKRGQSA